MSHFAGDESHLHQSEEMLCRPRQPTEPRISHRTREWECRYRTKCFPAAGCVSDKSAVPLAWRRRFPWISVVADLAVSPPGFEHRLGTRRARRRAPGHSRLLGERLPGRFPIRLRNQIRHQFPIHLLRQIRLIRISITTYHNIPTPTYPRTDRTTSPA